MRWRLNARAPAGGRGGCAGRQVPVVSFDSLGDFRHFVPACPDANYAWRLYGKLEVAEAGVYTLCSTSDDGSMLYADLTPDDKVCVGRVVF